MGFLKFYRMHAADVMGAFSDTSLLREVGENKYVWKAGKPKEQTFDFSPYFPIDNGGTPPYFRQRHEVDRTEAGLWFKYVERGGEGEFKPVPPPSVKRLQNLADDGPWDGDPDW